jgi:hypothetical protein
MSDERILKLILDYHPGESSATGRPQKHWPEASTCLKPIRRMQRKKSIDMQFRIDIRVNAIDIGSELLRCSNRPT